MQKLQEFDIDTFEKLNLLGFPIKKISENYATLRTKITPFKEQTFCIVDIETSGSDINSGQIIEIGAILMKNGKEIDRFESLVYPESPVPKMITELTGLDDKMLQNAPSLATTLEKFRIFLKDAVFVAHNVNFDYYFISDSFEQNGFPPLLNRKLCTIDLAKKTIQSERYGLEYLKQSLDLEEGQLHRAFSDAYNAMEILNICFKNLPDEVCTTEELLYFAKPNEKKRKPKHKKRKNRAKKESSTSKDL